MTRVEPCSASWASPTMKKTLIIFALLFLPSMALAQTVSSNFVFVSQGILSADSGDLTGQTQSADVRIGDGWTGSTTGAELAAQYTRTGSGDSYVQLVISGWPDDTYSTGSHSQCTYNSTQSSGSYPTGGGTFIDLAANNVDPNPDGSSGCILEPGLFYNVTYEVDFLTDTSGQSHIFGSPSTTTISWDVNSNTIPNMWFPQFAIVGDGFLINQPDYAGISTTTCSITNITGCFQNALTWAFYPPAGSLNVINSLWGQINTKPPFGYFTQTQNDISTLGASSSPAFSLPQVDGINTYIFDPIDLALAGVWWAIFGIWFFFNRLRHIEI